MAEVLIFNRENWMHHLTAEQIADYVKRYPNFMDKYNRRARKGDVVQIEDDGHFTSPRNVGYDRKHYDLVIVKGKTKAELEKLIGGPLLIDNVLSKKFKANLAIWTDKAEVALTNITVKVA